MNRSIIVSIVLCAAVGCAQRSPTGPEFVVPLFVTPAVKTSSPLASTHLGGEHEVPARDTVAQGQAIFKVSEDGLSISYKLIASNIDNIVQSHIHVAPAGVNGPIVVFLFGPVPAAGGRHDGVLAEGSFTAANLIGPLRNQPLSALLDAMFAGNAYVNVHTNDGVAPADTGPGDFPGGEVRGQIRAKGGD